MKKYVSVLGLLLVATVSYAGEVSRKGNLGSLVANIPVNGPRKMSVEAGRASWGEAGARYIAQNAHLIGARGDEQFVTRSVRQDELGEVHIRVQQRINDIPVVGAEVIVHASASTGKVRMINGVAISSADVPSKIDVDSQYAMMVATTDAAIADGRFDGEPTLSYLINEKGRVFLTWTSTVYYTNEEGEQIDQLFADAETGSLVARHPKVHYAKSRQTYNGNNTSTLPGTLRISEGGALTGDAAIDAAHTGAGSVWDYYSVKHGRDSYNGAGATMKSTAHHQVGYNNAFWNGTQMVYGDGDGSSFRPLSLAFDVVAHELTHAVTENEAALVYSNESGALNEGMSDIFGASAEAYKAGGISANTWKIGEDCYTPSTAGDALRYMNNPTQDGGSKDYYPERYTGTSDSGGVHSNSGIANLAYYLLVTGGSHPRAKTTVVVPALGMAAAEKIFYRALANYMTSNSNFQGARTATIQAATDLGYSTDAVSKAWEAVGVAPPAAATTLTNGVAVTSLSGATGSWKYYKITVPSGQTKLEIVQSGGTGDADLYVKRGAQPTSASYDYRPYLGGNAETVTVTNPVAGDWYVGIYSYAAYSGLSIKATYSGTVTPPSCTSLAGSLAGTGSNGYAPSSSGYASTISGTHTGKLTGPAAADFDLYLEKYSGTAWTIVARGETSTSTENVTYSGTAGTYRWRVYAYSGSGSYTTCTTKP